MDKTEKEMYITCFLVLIMCFIGLLFLKMGIKSITYYTIVEKSDTTKEDALNALSEAEKDIQEMIDNGFKVVYVNDTFIAAKKIFAGEEAKKLSVQKTLITEEEIEINYQEVLRLTKTIKDRKNEAYEINDQIRGLELKIEEYKELKIDTSKGGDLLEQAKIAFNDEKYEDAKGLIERAHNSLEEAKSEKSISKIVRGASLSFLKENLWRLIITFTILCPLFWISWKIIKKKLAKSKLQNLRMELCKITELIKEAQVDRYKKGNLSKEMYDIKVDKYKERANKIKIMIPILESLVEEKGQKRKKNIEKAEGVIKIRK